MSPAFKETYFILSGGYMQKTRQNSRILLALRNEVFAERKGSGVFILTKMKVKLTKLIICIQE